MTGQVATCSNTWKGRGEAVEYSENVRGLNTAEMSGLRGWGA